MKTIISIIFLLSFVACTAKVKVSDNLKQAWNIVNKEQDIYQRYSILEEEIKKIDEQLQNAGAEKASLLIAERDKLESELIEEEKQILKVQTTVEKADGKEIQYLASL